MATSHPPSTATAVPAIDRAARTALRTALRTARRAVLLIAATAAAAAEPPRLDLHEQPSLAGARLRIDGAQPDLASYGWRDRARSLLVVGRWEVCTQPQFRGSCLTLEPGRQDGLPPGMAARIASARPLDAAAGPTATASAGATPASAAAPTAPAALTLYQHGGFTGRQVDVHGAVERLGELKDFGDEASAVEIRRGRWQLCQHSGFEGRCIVLGPGRHVLSGSWNDELSSLRPVFGADDVPLPPGGGLTLYERADWTGRALLRTEATPGLGEFDFNDRAQSIEVHGGRWELCEDSQYRGRCTVFGPGRHLLAGTGLQREVTSLRSR